MILVINDGALKNFAFCLIYQCSLKDRAWVPAEVIQSSIEAHSADRSKYMLHALADIGLLVSLGDSIVQVSYHSYGTGLWFVYSDYKTFLYV